MKTLFVPFVVSTLLMIASGNKDTGEDTIDMSTGLYNVPDVYVPATHALQGKFLIDEAAQEFDMASYMSVRGDACRNRSDSNHPAAVFEDNHAQSSARVRSRRCRNHSVECGKARDS